MGLILNKLLSLVCLILDYIIDSNPIKREEGCIKTCRNTHDNKEHKISLSKKEPTRCNRV